MNCIVLVKQVPDVSNIPEDAWDREKGTLRRAMLDSILNPLDLHALTFADRLTRGDPDAPDGLPDAWARPWPARSSSSASPACRARRSSSPTTPSPAPTPAPPPTRSPAPSGGSSARCSAAAATTRSSPACSRSTATRPRCRRRSPRSSASTTSPTPRASQTEPQLAVRRIAAEGIEDVHPVRWPVLITVTACTDPLYRSFARAREARHAEIHEWNAKSVDADPTRIGLKGSWTQVYRLFSPSEDRPKTCEYVHDPAELIGKIAARYQQAAPGAAVDADEGYELDGKEPTYRGEFWVFAEREGDGVRSVSLELVAKARRLADSLGEKVGAVLPCDAAGDRPAQLIAAGADTVYVLEHPLLGSFDPLVHKKAIADLVRERKPQVMLFGASPLGRELAPRVAYACRSGLTADCTRLEIGDFSKGAHEPRRRSSSRRARPSAATSWPRS